MAVLYVVSCMRYFVFIQVYLLIGIFAVKAQNDVVKVIKLDEFVVHAGTDSLNVTDFVRRVKKDTTFYQAFLNLKYYPHHKAGEVLVFHKDESTRGTMHRKAIQHLDEREYMWVEITHERSNGNIKKRNGEWKYLTAEMYDEVFFPDTPHKVDNRIMQFEQELVGGSRIEKHKAQLKRMMFNPGAEIDNVPFIGDKLAIFDDHMVPYYDYAIYNAVRWGVECIAFSCLVKQGEEDNVVIQDLTSYFDPNTYEVLSREYRLAYSTIFFTFDIAMKVDNMRQDGLLLPSSVHYNGFWNVPLRKPEIIIFDLQCSDYTTEIGAFAK